MEKIYQKEWQGIRFRDLPGCSSSRLAGAEFYQAFYREFFRRHASWEDLPPSWREEKERVADLVIQRSSAGATVLSVGCGLGFVEHRIQERTPGVKLYLQELATAGWGWIERDISGDRRLLGGIPECLPAGLRFELIYLSAVDYALEDRELVRLLADLRAFLAPGGECLIISASFQPAPASARDRVKAVGRAGRNLWLRLGASLGLVDRGQFWGWKRGREEYEKLLQAAGYSGRESGFIPGGEASQYWIAGSSLPAKISAQ